MKPFDPEAALRGNPVRLRDGRKATLVKRRGEESSYPLIGEHEFPPESGNYIEDYWTEGGGYYVNGESSYDIVGMWEDLPPFNLEAALNGAPVRLRDGLKAWVRYHETITEAGGFPLWGFIDGASSKTPMSWTAEGRHVPHFEPHSYDIVGMWVEPEPVFEHWGLLSPGFVSMEKHSDAGVQWWVVRPREGRSMILIENDFAPGFFPDVPIGTAIHRPTEGEP